MKVLDGLNLKSYFLFFADFLADFPPEADPPLADFSVTDFGFAFVVAFLLSVFFLGTNDPASFST